MISAIVLRRWHTNTIKWYYVSSLLIPAISHHAVSHRSTHDLGMETSVSPSVWSRQKHVNNYWVDCYEIWYIPYSSPAQQGFYLLLWSLNLHVVPPAPALQPHGAASTAAASLCWYIQIVDHQMFWYIMFSVVIGLYWLHIKQTRRNITIHAELCFCLLAKCNSYNVSSLPFLVTFRSL